MQRKQLNLNTRYHGESFLVAGSLRHFVAEITELWLGDMATRLSA
jgi:hypothetical protein